VFVELLADYGGMKSDDERDLSGRQGGEFSGAEDEVLVADRAFHLERALARRSRGWPHMGPEIDEEEDEAAASGERRGNAEECQAGVHHALPRVGVKQTSWWRSRGGEIAASHGFLRLVERTWVPGVL